MLKTDQQHEQENDDDGVGVNHSAYLSSRPLAAATTPTD
jgi:hypothetical protein